jgi:3-oxoacyl-[acyl-carrier-protein] synthase II
MWLCSILYTTINRTYSFVQKHCPRNDLTLCFPINIGSVPSCHALTMSRGNRVVVTGIGVVAPNGVGKDPFWKSVLECRSGIGPITLFDAREHTCRVAGEVKDFDLTHFLKPKGRISRMSRQSQLALAAAKLALNDAGLDAICRNGFGSVPIILGISTSAIDIVEHGMQRMMDRGPNRVPNFIVSSGQPHHAVSLLLEEFTMASRAHTVSSACAAGLDGVAQAVDAVRSGQTEVAIAGGADAPVTPLTFACLDKAGLVGLYNEEPEHASRPFDRDRQTGVISEGAGVLILENLNHALARGASIYFEITGYGSQNDEQPDRHGSGLEYAMRVALANACKRPGDVHYICAHGPGHMVLDRAETAMIKTVFGDLAYRIPVSSIKGVMGNPLAAAGPLQLAACGFAIRDQIVPPTANLENADALCDLDYVPCRPRSARITCALVNCHGLGGGNSCMVVERVDRP